jgi:hypothetical protein
MLTHLARQHAIVWQTINSVARDPTTRDGNPRAQKKLEARVKAAGARTRLEPGKRGRYRLGISTWVGYNPLTDKRIGVDDEICDKPWIALDYLDVLGQGKCNIRFGTRLVYFCSHHALMRTCQRWKVITLADMLRVIDTLGAVGLEYICKAEDNSEEWWDHIPYNGLRLRVGKNGPTLICDRHENHKYRALVVVTVLD